MGWLEVKLEPPAIETSFECMCWNEISSLFFSLLTISLTSVRELLLQSPKLRNQSERNRENVLKIYSRGFFKCRNWCDKVTVGSAYDRKSCLILKVFLLKIFCFKDHHQVAVNYKSIKLTDLFLPMFLSFLNDALYGYIMTLEISILWYFQSLSQQPICAKRSIPSCSHLCLQMENVRHC